MENLIGIVITVIIMILLLALSNSFFKRLLAKKQQLPLKYLRSIVNFIIIVFGIYAIERFHSLFGQCRYMLF